MIIAVNGPQDKALELANSLRNVAISQGRGALILLKPEGEEHAIKTQIEKILDGAILSDNADIDQLKFKLDPMIIVTEETEHLLDEFEQVLVGFRRKFGPLVTTAGLSTQPNDTISPEIKKEEVETIEDVAQLPQQLKKWWRFW